MSDGHFGDRWSLPQLIPQTRRKWARNNRGQTRLEGPQPRRPFYPLQPFPSATSRLPGLPRPHNGPSDRTPHPVHGSGDGSQRILSASADLHRQRRSPARRALCPPPPFSSPNKHPCPEVTSLPSPPAPPTHSVFGSRQNH